MLQIVSPHDGYLNTLVVWGKSFDTLTRAWIRPRSFAHGFAQPGFVLGEPLVDRFVIGAAGRQVKQARARYAVLDDCLDVSVLRLG